MAVDDGSGRCRQDSRRYVGAIVILAAAGGEGDANLVGTVED